MKKMAYSFVLLLVFLVVTNGEIQGQFHETMELSSKASVLSLLLETLLKADDVLTNKFDALQKRVTEQSEEIADLRKQLAETNDRQNPTVAFSARVKPSYEDIAPWATIKFSSVETNIGDGYNSKTGVFTAPRTGVYVFYSHILTKGGYHIIETALTVNGDTKLWLYSAGHSSAHGSGSNMLVIRLKQGDKVKMVIPNGSRPFYIHHVWSTFSGFLL